MKRLALVFRLAFFLFLCMPQSSFPADTSFQLYLRAEFQEIWYEGNEVSFRDPKVKVEALDDRGQNGRLQKGEDYADFIVEKVWPSEHPDYTERRLDIVATLSGKSGLPEVRRVYYRYTEEDLDPRCAPNCSYRLEHSLEAYHIPIVNASGTTCSFKLEDVEDPPENGPEGKVEQSVEKYIDDKTMNQEVRITEEITEHIKGGYIAIRLDFGDKYKSWWPDQPRITGSMRRLGFSTSPSGLRDTVVIQNIGLRYLDITEIFVEGENKNLFEVTDASGRLLAPGQEFTIEVTFKPKPGEYSGRANLVICSNDPKQSRLRVALLAIPEVVGIIIEPLLLAPLGSE